MADGTQGPVTSVEGQHMMNGDIRWPTASDGRRHLMNDGI